MPADKRKPSRHLEVERKFAVVEGTVSPSFEGLSSITRVERSPVQQLDAVYYDTPGQDLASHRITLRRRTGFVSGLARTLASLDP
jgi:inorganic triphosphatase YgiF